VHGPRLIHCTTMYSFFSGPRCWCSTDSVCAWTTFFPLHDYILFLLRAPLLVVDGLLAVYLGWVVVPQFALLNVAVHMHPSTLYHHLRWSKVARKEEEHGIAGCALRWWLVFCLTCCLVLLRLHREMAVDCFN